MLTDDDGDGNRRMPSHLMLQNTIPMMEREIMVSDDDTEGRRCIPLDSTEICRFDNDGFGDNADSDDDGDGVEDNLDAFPLDSTESVDIDGDGIGNNADTDDDGDGVDDSKDVFPEDATEWEDANGDGLGDNKEPLSSFESAQQEPVMPLLGFAVVIGIMIMLYRAQPPGGFEKKEFLETNLEEE